MSNCSLHELLCTALELMLLIVQTIQSKQAAGDTVAVQQEVDKVVQQLRLHVSIFLGSMHVWSHIRPMKLQRSELLFHVDVISTVVPMVPRRAVSCFWHGICRATTSFA